MSDKPVLQPGPNHPITITPTTGRVVVTAGGKVVADSHNALTLQESTYPPVQYIPLADVDQTLLRRTETESYCPFKGDASYYSIPAGGDKAVDSVWEYPKPHDAVSEIAGHVAFWDGRVDSIEVQDH
ncbi:DUF427 domain-containing protein [Paractinoplanes ferrugineus]|uniref:DUF427 domain-containing protein n=1 Tax=Paractinoplanes ferrugineus TaxID=113564 RepID=A0A919J3N3_9ACTN|nr:DUF427 domain-containing protein [Actinoplanes ferrugineus]GIE12792.1 hypothetical protein Afe05nite_46320 [Actinoplanes ferrugineus]